AYVSLPNDWFADGIFTILYSENLDVVTDESPLEGGTNGVIKLVVALSPSFINSLRSSSCFGVVGKLVGLLGVEVAIFLGIGVVGVVGVVGTSDYSFVVVGGIGVRFDNEGYDIDG
ncbi:hypothetical protein ACJX0J_007557, partial [Zea mays]